MNREHVIADGLLEQAQIAFSKNEPWIAYNTVPYFLDKGDMYFFNDSDQAHEFADNNISEYDDYKVIHAYSTDELLKQIAYGERLEQLLSTSKHLSIMNEKNFDYLSNQLKYTGFGEELPMQLKDKMEKQEPQFTLSFQKDYGKDQTVAILHFRKSEDSDMYFFNRYSLMLKNEQHPDPIKQTFFINAKEENITLKEAYNLMSGRAVHKELTTKDGEKYNGWLQLDFKESDANGNYKMKQYHENYGYDLQATLNKHPIREMQNETDAQRLTESLQRGNRQSVTLEVNGKEQKVFIEAVPQFKSLNFYDSSHQRLRSDKLYENNSQEQSVKEDKKQGMKQTSGDDEGPGDDSKKKKRRQQKIS